MSIDDEVFGSPEQQALARRSASLWSLLRADPRFAWYGRLVALSDSGNDPAEVLGALARVQGAAVAYFQAARNAGTLIAELEAQGFATDRHEQYWGGESALVASRAVLASHALPADLTVHAIDAATPRQAVAAVAELWLSCGVMPVPGTVMRGNGPAGICLVALDRHARPVAAASSYLMHGSGSPHATDAFWGMLATREDRRGEGVALRLGAQAIVHMWERHGARGFMTGVKAGNASSQAVCRKLGVGPTDFVYASCMDRSQFGASSVTR